MSELQRVIETPQLVTLAELINAEHRAHEAAEAKAIEHAIRCGALLIEAKSYRRHGGWTAWLKENFEGSHDLANKYMKVARNSERVLNLPDEGRSISLRGALEEIKTSKEQERIAASRERAESMEKVSKLHFAGDVHIHHRDFRELELEEASADLILTDPPYPEEYLPLWEDFSRFAARVLKPGAVVATYAGQYHLPKEMEYLGKHLEYVWLGSCVEPGPMLRVGALAVQVRSKPLLFYKRRGDTSVNLKWCIDTYMSEAPDKKHHHWGQPLGATLYYMERLTKPGDLVVDPFLGGGTTAAAAQQLGRRFIGCDVDWMSVAAAKERLAA